MDGVKFYVGIDWGSATHQVCVLNAERKVVEEKSWAHDGDANAALADRLTTVAEGNIADVVVGIETPWSAIVDTLMERGFRVFHINPKQLDRFRDRHTAAGAKDDRRDALVIASSLSTDDQAFHQVKPSDPKLIVLRELSHIWDELNVEQRAVAGRLYAQVLRVFPQVFELGSVYTDQWLVALLTIAPTPEQLRMLTLAKVRKVLKDHGVRKLTAEDVRNTLGKRPLHLAPGVAQAAQTHIAMLVSRLQLLNAQLRETKTAISKALDELEEPSNDPNRIEHRDVTILRSLPGVGKIVAATMLSEAREALQQRDYQRLRLLAGVAPVTKQSGKSRSVSMRRACSRRLRSAMFFFASVFVREEERARALYATHRARGASHGRALRTIADRALKMLVSMLQTGSVYDPTRRAIAAA